MALTIGTDSYVSLEDAEAYLSAYVDEDFAVDVDNEAAVERALRQATLAIERLYGGRFIGTPTSEDQALHFPTDGSDEIPAAVEQATSELAYLILEDDLDPYAQPDPIVSKEGVKIDVLEFDTEFARGSATNSLYKIEVVLAPYLYAVSGLRFAEVVRG